MKTEYYEVSNDADHVNKMGELGWELLYRQPIVIGRYFDMPHDAPILKQWVEVFEFHANKQKAIRDRLESNGFRMKRVYMDDAKTKVWKLIDYPQSPLYKWRIEFSTTLDPNEEKPMLGITFGPPELNVPTFCDRKVIDRYVPKEWIEDALTQGCIELKEAEEEVPQDTPTPTPTPTTKE